MLLDIRDGIRNSKWLKYVLVGIICVPFALFGVNSYFNNHGPDYAVKVNGQKVPLNVFQNAYYQSRQQVQQTFGGQLPQGLDLGTMINNQAMENVVRQEVLRQSTIENGFAVGNEDLAQQIFAVDVFNVDGVFDKERYTNQLQAMGVSASEFEEQFRGDLLLQQFRESVVGTGFSLADENARVDALRNQQRLASTITLDTQAKAETIDVSDEEITAHYDANLNAFNDPEKVKVEYIELRIDDLTSNIEVTDESLMAYFEQNKSQWVVEERRDASHILLAVDRDASSSDVDEKKSLAEELAARINAGESMDSLAPEFSDDPGSADNGGSLGEFGRGVMVPEFEEVVYLMNVGEVSEPVRSDFGFHIIQLDNVVAEQGQSFEEVKDEVESQYRVELSQTEYFKVSELLSNASYENTDSLQPAADESELELQTSDWIDRSTFEGIGAYPQVLAAALSDDVLNDGINSELLEVGENHAIVLRTIEHEVAKPKPMEDVREDIIGRVQSEKATSELETLADTLIEKLNTGAEASALADEHGGEFTETVAVGRTGSDFDRSVVSRLFTMQKPSDQPTYESVRDSAGNIVTIIFSGIESGATEETTEAAPSSVPAGSEFEALISAIQEEAKIERNEHLLSPNQYQ